MAAKPYIVALEEHAACIEPPRGLNKRLLISRAGKQRRQTAGGGVHADEVVSGRTKLSAEGGRHGERRVGGCGGRRHV